MEILLDGINSRLDAAEEKINELSKMKTREKNFKKERESQSEIQRGRDGKRERAL